MSVSLDTQRLSFPSTAVATRKTITQRQSQSTKNVCAAQAQSKDLNFCGLKTNAKVLTNIATYPTRDEVCKKRSVFRAVRYFLIHQRTLQKDSRRNHNLFLLFFATVMSMLFYKPPSCNGFGVSLSISISAYRSRCCFFFSMMAAGRWYCSRVRLGRNVTPPLHTHTPPLLVPPLSTRPPRTFPPPPPPHPPPSHLQGGLISIRIEPGLPFPVTDIYKTIGQCARVCQLHFLFFSVCHCVFVSRQVTAR